MNKIIKKILLTGDKIMPELHLKQPPATYRVCGQFTKHYERNQQFRETCNLKHLYRNDLDKTGLDHDATYSDSKDLAKTTISDAILKNRAFEVARNCKYGGYQGGLASMVYNFIDKKTRSGVNINEQLAEELHKPVIKKILKKKSLCEIWRQYLCRRVS